MRQFPTAPELQSDFDFFVSERKAEAETETGVKYPGIYRGCYTWDKAFESFNDYNDKQLRSSVMFLPGSLQLSEQESQFLSSLIMRSSAPLDPVQEAESAEPVIFQLPAPQMSPVKPPAPVIVSGVRVNSAGRPINDKGRFMYNGCSTPKKPEDSFSHECDQPSTSAAAMATEQER